MTTVTLHPKRAIREHVCPFADCNWKRSHGEASLPAGKPTLIRDKGGVGGKPGQWWKRRARGRR